jgi:hypothetical protein
VERIPAAVELLAVRLWDAKEMLRWLAAVVAAVVTWLDSLRLPQHLDFLWKGSRYRAVYGPTSYSTILGHRGL